MKPPADAIETSHALIWAEDGIVFSVSRGVRATDETIEENFVIYRDLTQDSRRPLLLDARKWWGGSPDAWGAAIANMESTFAAVAMLVEPETAATVGAFPAVITRLVIPFQVFTDEAEALLFLHGYLPNERPNLEPPDDAVRTTGATIWMDGGVLFSVPRGLPSTAETISEAFGVYRDITGGVPAPLLLDARDWPGGDTDAWATIASELGSVLTACALLIGPDSPVPTGPFFLNRLAIPTQVFADEAQAFAFLKGFLPSE